ncbi:MAG: DNA polymerase III subunit gamma/tau [Ignavibacteria bacterium]|nr:DNA polymerase III subunit gamma/tau [Ignavibacteria bacterium]
MTYLVTARKWRPMIFEDIVGQAHVATTLRNAIASHRLSHAYIFSGPRGCGKTTTARILAKAINCLHPVNINPDNECALCKEITEGRSVNVFEIDGASNRGVEEIRNLREAVRYGPARGKYKVYIIDEVHMLTKEAFNALLKTLEEPPSYVVFIFATTEIHKVPLTILSRCQRFDFRRIALEEITARLRFIANEEHITIDDDALMIIAKRGDGSLRDAQSLFDQVVSYCGEDVSAKNILSMLNIVDQEMYFRLSDVIKARDVKAALLLVNDVINCGYDLREFLVGVTEHFRNLLVVLSTGSGRLIETSEVYKKRYMEDAHGLSETDLLRLIKISSETEAALRWSQQPRLKLEIGLMQMAKLDHSVEISQLLQQLDELKKKVVSDAKTESPKIIPPSPQQSTEAPVRGSVKASQPTLRAEQIVSPVMQTLEPFSFKRTSPFVPLRTTVNPEMIKREVPLGTLSQDEAFGKWSELVDEARKQRIAIGTMLSEASLIEVKENRLRIGCPDHFHLDGLNVKRNRQFLLELAEKVYGAQVQLETILASTPSPSDHRRHDMNVSAHTPVPKNDHSDHPVIQALIREFGAKEIE